MARRFDSGERGAGRVRRFEPCRHRPGHNQADRAAAINTVQSRRGPVMNYFCCDERRRAAVLAHPTLNGIDFVEVLDDPANPSLEKQKLLQVHFLKKLAPGQLSKDNFRIDGGERIKNIAVAGVTQVVGSPPSSPPAASQQVLLVAVSTAGDFSTYTLRLVRDSQHPDPPDGFDPMLASVEFSFKIACQSDFDCKPARV